MTVTLNAPTQTGPSRWEFSYSSDQASPTFRVYHEGLLIDESARTTVQVQSDTEPVIEVYDATTTPSQWTYPGRVRLQWYHQADADAYRVYEYVNSTWLERITLQDHGPAYHQWQSRWLSDVTTAQFRVVALDTLRNEGTEVDLNVFIVRNPDPPQVTVTYSGGNIVVDNA
mgnify:FL=1